MKQQKEAIEMLVNKGAFIYKDLLKGTTTFRVIDGVNVKRFPLELLEHMKEKGIVTIQKVVSLHSEYKIVPKKKRKKLGIAI